MNHDISTTSLKDRITEFTAQMMKQVPAEVGTMLGAELGKLAESGIAKRALKAGAKAPDFSLPDSNGKMVTLASLLTKGPAVVTFYRGGWCPFCDLQLRTYQESLGAIHDLGAELVAISAQTKDYALSDVETKKLTFPVLTDAHNEVSKKYALVFTLGDTLKQLQTGFGNPIPKFNGDDSWELVMPGTFVIDRNGIVKLAHVDPNWMVRLEPAAILGALQGAK